MRVSTMAPVAVFLLVITGSACDPGIVTTTSEEQQSDEDSGGGGDSSGSQNTPPAADEEEPNAPGGGGEESTPEEGSEPADEPIMLGLGGSHRFEDGFTVTMSSVERRTEPASERSDVTVEEDSDEGESSEDESMDGLDGTEPMDEETTEDQNEESTDGPAVEEESSEEELSEEDPGEEDPSPVEDGPVDEGSPEDGSTEEETPEEEPVEEGTEDEGEDYYAWTVEITNGTDEEVHTGSIITECFVGAPLRESSGPLLGEALNPPTFLAPDGSGGWDEDCWADEDDPTLRWTLEFIDEEGRSLYPALVFEGQVY